LEAKFVKQFDTMLAPYMVKMCPENVMMIYEALGAFSDCGRMLHALWNAPDNAAEEAYAVCRNVARSPVPGLTYNPIGTEPNYTNIFPHGKGEFSNFFPFSTPAPDYEYIHSIQFKAGLSPLMQTAMVQCCRIASAMSASQGVEIIPILRFIRYPQMTKRVSRETGLHNDYSLFTFTLCDNLDTDKGSHVFFGELSAVMGLGDPTPHKAIGAVDRDRYSAVVFFVPESRQTSLTDFASVESLDQIEGPRIVVDPTRGPEPIYQTVDDYYQVTFDKARNPEQYQSVLEQ
jgi:hypothetical protein